MTNPFKSTSSGNQSPASLIAALVLVALVPTVCVLWFMTVAMRNERLAVQERLAGVYLNHLTSLQRQVASFWQVRQAALQSAAKSLPAETFAAIVRSGAADSVVVLAGNGGVLHPSSAVEGTPVGEKGEWAAARELEYQKKNYAAAAEAYRRVAEASGDFHTKARALQSGAGCLLKAGQKEAAIRQLEELAGESGLRGALSAQGTLIVPNVQLLLVKLAEESVAAAASEVGPDFRAGLNSSEVREKNQGRLGEPAPPSLRKQTLSALVARLNDYSEPALSSNQRRFLMAEVKALDPASAVFPTLAAEELAAEYLEQTPSPSAETKLQRTSLPKVWRLATADRTIVALLREDRLRRELAGLLDSLALPDVRVTLLAPGESFAATNPIAPQDAGEFLPGWRLGLSFKGDDPLVTASVRQTRFYLWTGFVVVVVIGIVALLVARYVSAQIRLARLKNELVSTVSHELKTPLASMRALVDTLVAGRYRDERQLRDYLDLIAKENVRLSHLIENFLTFSRLERGRQQFRFEALEPAHVFAEAVDALREKLGAAQCSFTQSIEPGLPRIRGDADALSTVLINLLDNACKYTDGDKRISARAYANGRQVCFEVTDNGIGFARSEVKKIFDRFYQVDQSLTKQRGGCGLGLGIVQYIVRAHDGTVQVESEPGKGSVFRVMIPQATINAGQTLNA